MVLNLVKGCIGARKHKDNPLHGANMGQVIVVELDVI